MSPNEEKSTGSPICWQMDQGNREESTEMHPLKKAPEKFTGKRKVFSTTGTEITRYLYNWTSNPYLTPYSKINFRRIIDQWKSKNCKASIRKNGRIPSWPWDKQRFLRQDTASINHKNILINTSSSKLNTSAHQKTIRGRIGKSQTKGQFSPYVYLIKDFFQNILRISILNIRKTT